MRTNTTVASRSKLFIYLQLTINVDITLMLSILLHLQGYNFNLDFNWLNINQFAHDVMLECQASMKIPSEKWT